MHRSRHLLVLAIATLMALGGCSIQELRRSDQFAELRTVAFSPDGNELAVGRDIFNVVYLFDAKSLRLKQAFLGNPVEPTEDRPLAKVLAIDPKSGRAAIVENNGGLAIFDLASNKPLLRIAEPKPVQVAAFSPDSEYVAAAGDARVALWSIADARLLGTFSDHGGPVRSLAFSPDGRLIASGSDDRTIRIWTTATQEQVARLEGHAYPVHSIAFAPDATKLAVYSGEPQLWNLSDGQSLTTLLPNADTSLYEGIAVLASLLASARSMQLGGGPIGAPPIGASTMPTGPLNPIGQAFNNRLPVRFSPDGKRLAVLRFNMSFATMTDYEVAILDVASGKTTLSIHCQCVRMAFSPDGKSIATLASLGQVRLWDAFSGKEIAAYRGPFPLQGVSLLK